VKKEARVFIGVGTNLGNRMEHINRAYSLLESMVGKIRLRSSVYISPPWGFEADQDFYNTVIELETILDPHALLIALKAIEVKMGRVKTKATGYESRIIDLDIIDFDKQVLIGDNLQLPHPHLHRRGFVLWPLQEICPQWAHPVSGKKIDALVHALEPAETPDKLKDTNI